MEERKMKEQKKKICIYLKEDTYKRMEYFKYYEGETLSDFVNKAIEKYCQYLYERYMNDVYTAENITDD